MIEIKLLVKDFIENLNKVKGIEDSLLFKQRESLGQNFLGVIVFEDFRKVPLEVLLESFYNSDRVYDELENMEMTHIPNISESISMIPRVRKRRLL